MQAVLLVENLKNDVAPVSLAQEHILLVASISSSQDRTAFNDLFRFYGPRIKSIMLKSGASHDLAEDLVQIVMMTVWRKAKQFAPERGSAAAWIFTIARNARIDHLRRGTSQPYLDIDELEITSDEPNGEDNAIAAQRAEIVAAALKKIPADQREIIEQAYMESISQSEIAKKLNVPLGTVKSRMRLAYAKLKDSLEDLK